MYGGLDGMITTFAIVSGVIGADLSTSVILILGFANLVGDGFSMAAGSYLSIRSEHDYQKEELLREQWEIENYPEGEIEEIRQIYRKKGFEGENLEAAVKIITSDKERWLQTMMIEELGLLPDNKSPFTAGLITFGSFVLWGFLPLLAFMLVFVFSDFKPYAFEISIFLTGFAIFVAGALRSLIIAKAWIVAGLEMLLVGGIASGIAYAIGYLLRGIAY